MAYQYPLNGGRINATIGGNTAGAGSLVSSGTLTLAGGNNITLSQAGNAVTISGAAGGAGSNTFGMSNLGNTSGTSGVISGSQVRYVFAGGNNITLSQSINASSATITISAPNQSVQTQGLQTVVIGSNTAGATASISSGAMTLAGGNNITLSQAGNAITISGGAGGGGGGIALANSQTTYTSGTANLAVAAGAAMTIASTTGQSFNFSVPATSSLSATGAISISTNGSTISIGAPIAGHTHSFYQNLVPQNSVQPYTTLAVGFRTMLVQPLSPVEGLGFPGDMTISTFMMQMSGSQTATSATSAWSSSYGSTISVGLYLLNNSSQLTLVNSASTAWSASANTQNSTGWAGARFLTIHSSLWSAVPALTEGERYWYGVLHSSTNFSNMGPSWLGQYIGASTQRSGTIGVSQATNTSMGMVPFLGIYSASLGSIPNSLGNSQINKVNVSAGFAPSVILNATVSAF